MATRALQDLRSAAGPDCTPAAERRFKAPPPGALAANDDRHDPLKYYYAPLVGLLYRNRIESGLALLRPPFDSILEIGYGSGVLMPTLCALGRNVCGIDPTSDPRRTGAHLAALGAHPRLARADITTWAWAERPFDLVVAFSVFEHVPDPHAVMGRVARLLAPGGHLLVGMPRVDRLMSYLFPLIGYRHIDDFHVTRHRDLIACSAPYFVLRELRRFPFPAPRWAALYFNMLF